MGGCDEQRGGGTRHWEVDGRAACGTAGRRYSAPAAQISISTDAGDDDNSSPLPFGWDGRSVVR